jgi:hypothetical protein
MIASTDFSDPSPISRFNRASRHGGTTPVTNPSPVKMLSPKYSARPSSSHAGSFPPITAWAN